MNVVELAADRDAWEQRAKSAEAACGQMREELEVRRQCMETARVKVSAAESEEHTQGWKDNWSADVDRFRSVFSDKLAELEIWREEKLSHIKKLETELAAAKENLVELAEKLAKSEAANAEMRECILDDVMVSNVHYKEKLKALVLSTEAGQGWISPEAANQLSLQLMSAQLKLRAADAMGKAVDDAVTAGWLNARCTIADARLDYGEPFKSQAMSGCSSSEEAKAKDEELSTVRLAAEFAANEVATRNATIESLQADAAALRRAVEHAAMHCNACDGTGQDDDGEQYINAPCPRCKIYQEALFTDAGKGILEELEHAKTQAADITEIVSCAGAPTERQVEMPDNRGGIVPGVEPVTLTMRVGWLADEYEKLKEVQA